MPVGRDGGGHRERKPHAINPTASTHGHFVLSPASLALRDQDGGPSNSTIDIYDLTEK